MAKRFTDVGKWKRPWFQALSKDAKLLWLFLCDDCDHAGIWIADFELMSLRLGMKVDEAKLRDLVGDKLVKIDADKFFIPSFYEFQYRDAKDGFKAKQSAMKTLRLWNLLDDSDCLIDLSNSYLSVQEQSPDCHIIGKIKIKGNTGGVGETKATPSPYAGEWNEIVGSLPKVREWTKEREKKSKEIDWDKWAEACRKVEASEFLSGRDGKWTACSVDWLLDKKNLLKVIEGKYDNRAAKPAPATSAPDDAVKVAHALKTWGAWSNVQQNIEVREYLGDVLYALAIKAGVSKMRQLQANDFYLKNIAGMLKDAAREGAA